MKRYIIERDLPGVGDMTHEQLSAAADKSNHTIDELGGRVQWIHSYVAADKTFCLYMAESEAAVKDHARMSCVPASKITEISGTIDPMTADTP